jgi:hypothetical protein
MRLLTDSGHFPGASRQAGLRPHPPHPGPGHIGGTYPEDTLLGGPCPSGFRF